MNNKKREEIEDQFKLGEEISSVELLEWDVIAQLYRSQEWVVKSMDRYSK